MRSLINSRTSAKQKHTHTHSVRNRKRTMQESRRGRGGVACTLRIRRGPALPQPTSREPSAVSQDYPCRIPQFLCSPHASLESSGTTYFHGFQHVGRQQYGSSHGIHPMPCTPAAKRLILTIHEALRSHLTTSSYVQLVGPKANYGPLNPLPSPGFSETGF